ncbi:50S ribosomal protein L32 [Aceticella autotrophica]|jgi:large subunit ribosomal protein L32|uniref:Large ribosomal subunit protein bL32 n=1 Tax=Aceticella autotrophica TaxID=2755338 RepID=A0A975G9Q4_9THEO|nr:50S ribosomal protein L32 [Aceticella autotrophica]MDI6604675.1 50S ribosomal protein L32 [Thermoanaerobacteraceae bacterium]QSZ26651.1 50S ribosomal protein L32 [Aceticella autotrophica]
MPVPKRKTSKARRDKRRHSSKLKLPAYVLCPQCHEPKLPHRVCKNCGFYNDREVIKVEE